MTVCSVCRLLISLSPPPDDPEGPSDWRLGLGGAGSHICIDRGVHVPTRTELEDIFREGE